MNVVIFEARHAKTIADLVKAQGGTPVSAPAMKEVPLENNPEVFSFAEKLFSGQIDVLIFLTGVGARTLLSALETKYPREKVLEAFRKIPIVPRGPKPIRALNEWQVPYALTVPEPNTWKELLAALDQNKEKVPVSGKTVAVQEYGVPNPELVEGLKKRGAHVLTVPVYRWALPDDLAPLEKAIGEIVAGKADVAMFTTAVQIEHVFQVARRLGLPEKLKEAFLKTVVASIGPDCTKAIRSHGVEVDIQPENTKMGVLVSEVISKAPAILKKKRE